MPSPYGAAHGCAVAFHTSKTATRCSTRGATPCAAGSTSMERAAAAEKTAHSEMSRYSCWRANVWHCARHLARFSRRSSLWLTFFRGAADAMGWKKWGR